MFFSFVTLAIVFMSNKVFTRMQEWMVDNSISVDKTLTSRAAESNKALNPSASEESCEEFEPYEVETETEVVEETEIPA